MGNIIGAEFGGGRNVNAPFSHKTNVNAMTRGLMARQMTENMKKNLQQGGGLKHLLQMSMASGGGRDTGYYGLAPSGFTDETSEVLSIKGIDPTLAVISGSIDGELNKYLHSKGREANRLNTNSTSTISLSKKKFDERISAGEIDVLDSIKGVYKMKTRIQFSERGGNISYAETEGEDFQRGDAIYALKGDLLHLDRMGSYMDGVTQVLTFKNMTSAQDQFIIERFELDLPLTPSPKTGGKKGRGKGKKGSKGKTGGKKGPGRPRKPGRPKGSKNKK